MDEPTEDLELWPAPAPCPSVKVGLKDEREGASGFRREGCRGPVPGRRALGAGDGAVEGAALGAVEVESMDLEMEALKAWVRVPFARW